MRGLVTVTRTQGTTEALKDGYVAPDGYRLDFEEVPVLIDGFRRMVRELAYDVCEMAFTTYLCARAYGKAFTALPVFLVRGFHHGAILRGPTGAKTPGDLEGGRVGVHRGYTVTTGVWARGMLSQEYSVDLDRVTWVLSGDEHVAEYRPPPNVVPLPAGGSLPAMLAAGELAAVIGITQPGLEPLIPDPTEAAFAALRRRGLYPINHLVVVRDELLRSEPGLAVALFEAFAAAKRHYVDRLRQGRIAEPNATDLMYRRVAQTLDADPLPYGVAPNQAMIEQLIAHAMDQRILDRAPSISDIFDHSTLDLVG